MFSFDPLVSSYSATSAFVLHSILFPTLLTQEQAAASNAKTVHTGFFANQGDVETIGQTKPAGGGSKKKKSSAEGSGGGTPGGGDGDFVKKKKKKVRKGRAIVGVGIVSSNTRIRKTCRRETETGRMRHGFGAQVRTNSNLAGKRQCERFAVVPLLDVFLRPLTGIFPALSQSLSQSLLANDVP